jgi:hypothetical protein
MRWDGSSWNVVQSPNFGSNSTYLSKVAALSSEDVWAIGGYNIGPDGARPISLHWDGSQWSTIQMPYGPGFAHSLVDISAVAPDDIWAVGGSFDGFMSRTSIEHWNGNEWSIIPSPNPGPNANALYGVTAITTNDVWAVGYYYPNMSSPSANLVLHWDGSVWTQVAAPNAGTSSNNLWDVDAVAGNDVWAIGTFLNAGVEETLALHWDGSQWAVVPTPNSGSSLNRLFGVAASAADDVWAVGYTSTQSLIERYSSQCVTVTPTPSITPPVTASATSTTVPPTACTSTFTDVDETNAFYPYIRCLACRGIISGYDDGTFRPFNDITRGQIAKIVSNAAGFDEDPGPQIYEDVPVGSPFYQWINRLSMRGHIGGYPCGLMEGEPCIEPDNLPYFRPSNSATRGQLAKIVANAAGVEGTPSGIIYSDVPEDHPFYLWIMRLTEAGVMSGYPCGAPGEPCNPQSRPFFRPSNNVTRGQASKIVANTFFPGCQTP